MAGFVAFGDLVFIGVGVAGGYFARPYVDAVIAWVKAKF